MFRTSKCSTSGRLVNSANDQNAYVDACKKCHKTACTSLPDDEHLYVRKNVEDTIIKLTLWRRNFLLNFSTPCI
jgi:hypothetical protein